MQEANKGKGVGSARGPQGGMGSAAPSEAAVRVAVDVAHEGPLNNCNMGSDTCDTVGPVRGLLAAAHDPANFKDPREVSVNLGAVLDELRDSEWHRAANHLLRRFGGDRG